MYGCRWHSSNGEHTHGCLDLVFACVRAWAVCLSMCVYTTAYTAYGRDTTMYRFLSVASRYTQTGQVNASGSICISDAPQPREKCSASFFRVQSGVASSLISRKVEAAKRASQLRWTMKGIWVEQYMGDKV